jgi:predicted transcriptional regulator
MNESIQTNKSFKVSSTLSFEELQKLRRFRRKSKILRRSQLERYIDILRAINEKSPIKQTHVMYKANLSWMELKKDLDHLLDLKLILIMINPAGNLYSISESGFKILQAYNSVDSVLNQKEEPSYPQKNVVVPTSKWSF